MTAGVLHDVAGEARELARFSRGRPGFLFGLGVVALTIFLAVFGPSLAPYGPEEALPGVANLPPGEASAFWASPVSSFSLPI